MLRRALVLSFTTLMLALNLTAIAGAQETRRIVTTNDADYFGFDLRTERNVSLDECKRGCLADRQCRAFTYNTRAEWCFLKSDFSTLNPFAGAVAGKVVVAGGGPDLGAPGELDFVSEGIRAEAQAYRDRLAAAATRFEGRGIAGMIDAGRQALAQGDPRRAMSFLSAALTLDESNSAVWSDLSRAIQAAEPANNQERYQLQQYATSTAFSAYLTSRTADDRAGALEVMAKALEMRSQFRPALEAYKASLALVASPRVEADYADLKARKGFRVIDHSIDADNASPRVCIQLSEELVKSGVDYGAYVQLNSGPAPALEAKGRQICVEGLAHGEHYNVTLRAGLPAAIGEKLEQAVPISVYVRDRGPSVRFTGDNFVLPGAMRHGIPVISINTSSVKLKLHRLGDRALASLLANDDFLRQLNAYQADRITETTGELVWEGTLDVRSSLNREVTTSFPVDDVLPERRAGVYVLTASAAEQLTEEWDDRATQWFVVSDVGLSSQAGTDGLSVFTRSLDSAAPLGGVSLKLIARNNEVLGETTTDGEGLARFDAGLMRGRGGMEPAVLLATHESAGFVFMDMTQAGFDLSDRGVEGRAAPGAIDVFAWTERGIYRGGDTVHAAALARSDAAQAIDALPLTFVFRRPDGKEDRRIVSSAPLAGGHVVDLDLPVNAMQGAWQMRIFADPKGDVLAEHTFLVEDFVPDRIEFDLTSEQKAIDREAGAQVIVDGRYLYGAPAAGLTIEGEVRVTAVSDRDGQPGYVFGLGDTDEEGVTTIPLDNLPLLDADGKAVFDVALEGLPATTRPQVAKVTVRMREGGGRAVERTLDLPVLAEGTMIGVKPEFDGDQVREGSTASFRVIAVAPDGERTGLAGIRWSLVRISRNYQWYREGSGWRYEAVDFTEQVANGTFDALAGEEVKIAAPVDWGHYRLQLETADVSGPATSTDFYAGWYVESASLDTPDGLEIALDRESYRAGDVAKLKVSPRFAGELMVTVGADRLLARHFASVPADGATLDIPVGEDWGAGAYVTATLFRPGSAAESRMPMRAIGLKWLKVDASDRTLGVEIATPAQALPNQALDIPLTVTGAKAGETVYATVAAVDVGILNLTAYTPPEPQGWYYGQRQMGLELRDIYGRLIDGSLGAAGRIRTGGDGAMMQSQGSPPKGKLVAFFSGPVRLDSAGKATVSFDMPQFNGTVRVMAVAWSKAAVGSAAQDVIVREPVVVTAGLPRFMATGDVAQMRLDIANTDGPGGDYAVSIAASGPVSVTGSGAPSTIQLAAGGRQTLIVPIAAGAPGVADLDITLTHADGVTVRHALSLPVRPATLPVTTRMEIPLAADGGSLLIDRQLLAASILRGASVSVSVSPLAALDVPAMLMSLDRYPYGCAEQTTSRALPLLYLSELQQAAGMETDPEVVERIEGAITRVLAYQSASGAFGLWGPGSGDLWLDAYVSDFLTRAREKGFDVPEQGMTLALQNLENALAYTSDVKDRGREIAYALYVLARNRRASAGDLRYYSDTQMDAFDSPMARAQLGASLALYGDGQRSAQAFGAAFRLASETADADGTGRSDYGSRLRDGAAILALAAESRPAPAGIPQMIDFVAEQRKTRRYTSTQEDAWMLLAARALAESGRTISLAVDGVPHQGSFSRRVDGAELTDNPIRIENRTGERLTAVVTAIASPVQPLPAGGDGFTITRGYYRMDGSPANLSSVRQNERLVAVIQVTELNAWPSRIIVNDLLPAGLEIDNPRIMGSAELKNFDWIGQTEPAHLEFRDDRFIAALDRRGNEERRFNLAYVVRAVTPGTYVHPAASVEDMYRPELSARTATGFMEVRVRTAQ